MVQANQSTAAEHVDPQGEPNSFDMDPEEAIRSGLAHGKHAVLTAGADGQEMKVASQSVSTHLVSTGYKQNEDNSSQILTFPQLGAWHPPAVTFHALQEWEGYILEIRPEDVVARLIDLTAGASQEEEEAVIPLTEISDDDAVKMREGSIFRWVIGYERSAAGTKKRVSQIVFRDLPAMTKSDLQDGQAWADRISESFDR